MAGGNISLSFGIMELVRKGFRRLHLYDFLNGFKEKGVPLGYVVELMCIHQLNGGASMNKCESDTSSPLAREELCHGHKISRKTMERALDLLDTYFEDTIWFLWERLNEIYPDLNTDVYVDGSHITRYGSKGENTAAGEGGGAIQLQDQFVVAQFGRFRTSDIHRTVSGQLERSSTISGLHPAADVPAEGGFKDNHGCGRIRQSVVG